ncbi:MAG: thymidylate synthase [Candidatus Berkelbacteria bacterium Athens1014_28]|uniref:Thymidylate synthase n=1 Tax=Candidatus Berkelbacteria bacterium Athens1014_28 TaxID=2017145 RepID=A0A554LL37_9BACT|nr:MAG: thymidylate synthase [Candidatus Berkelbacteria bacterium Athens1014_28]
MALFLYPNNLGGGRMSESMFDLPTIHIEAETLPEAWEKAVLECWEKGTQIATQYDNPGDPPSRDCSIVIAVEDPLAQPRIHRAIPGGIDDLEVYRQEVVDGIHDHWIDPKAGKWQYTYHERCANYRVPGLVEAINQIDYVVDTLVDAPHSRRAQIVLWKPWEDAGISHPACLQRLWFRIFGDRLVMSAHMRSNDAFKAAFMNMYAFTDLQRVVAERISEKLGREIKVGQYNHIADSFHIYGSYFSEFEGFLRSVETRTWEQRTYRTDDPDIAKWFEEAREKIATSLAEEQAGG